MFNGAINFTGHYTRIKLQFTALYCQKEKVRS